MGRSSGTNSIFTSELTPLLLTRNVLLPGSIGGINVYSARAPSMKTCVPGSLGSRSFTSHVPLVASSVIGVRTVTGTSLASVSLTVSLTGVLPSAG